MLVYDITNISSFKAMQKWYYEVIKNSPNDIIIVIAANKEDLVELEVVDMEEALEFSRKTNAMFFKTSAKNGFGVNDMFDRIGIRIAPKQRPFSFSLLD